MPSDAHSSDTDTVGEDDQFSIPNRPTRITHDTYTVTDEDGEPVTDENGEPVTAGGGSTIEGYTQFTLTAEEFDREVIGDVVETAGDWGPYVLSEWERFNQLVYDEAENCPFEVRVLDDRVVIDVKASTTSEAVRAFVERLADQVSVEWEVERTSEKLAA